LDVSYLKKFQQGLDFQHGANLVAQITENIEILEKVAAEIFRLVSNQAKGTPLDMRVDPYAISLADDADMTLHEKGMERDEAIAEDVDHMWFYNKQEIFQTM
jgi:hypothetical protein